MRSLREGHVQTRPQSLMAAELTATSPPWGRSTDSKLVTQVRLKLHEEGCGSQLEALELQEGLQGLVVPHSEEGEADHTDHIHSRASHIHHTGTAVHLIYCQKQGPFGSHTFILGGADIRVVMRRDMHFHRGCTHMVVHHLEDRRACLVDQEGFQADCTDPFQDSGLGEAVTLRPIVSGRDRGPHPCMEAREGEEEGRTMGLKFLSHHLLTQKLKVG